MRRRREAPLPSLLHVLPLIEQIHRERALFPAERSNADRRPITNPIPGTPSRHFPDAAISASKGRQSASWESPRKNS